MSQSSPESTQDLSGHISNLGLLDLSSLQDAAALSRIRHISNVGLVLIPENLQAEFGAIQQSNVGAVVPIPAGEQVKTLMGQLTFPGDAFAEQDPEHPVLVLVGQVVFTSRVTAFGYSQVIIVGQVLAPEGSEPAIARCLTRLIGQAIYYPGNSKPRIMKGSDTLDEAYFKALPEAQVLIVLGRYRFAPDVTIETLRGKVAALLVFGELETAPGIVSAVRALASEICGVLKSY